MRLIWHIQEKASNKHDYYASLDAFFLLHPNAKSIGVSRSKITKDSAKLETWEHETGTHSIRKGRSYSVSDFK